MRINNNTNYFNRYLKLNPKKFKSLGINQDSNAESTDKIKPETRRKQQRENKSTMELSTDNQLTKKEDTQIKGQSNSIELLIVGSKSDLNSEPSYQEAQRTIDNGLIPKRDIPLICENITGEHIDFLEMKIISILNVIEEFKKENDLNQKPMMMKMGIIYKEEPQTERISNKMNDQLSLLNTARLKINNSNHKELSHPFISYKENTKQQNQLHSNMSNSKNNGISHRRHIRTKVVSQPKASIMTKTTQKDSQLIGDKSKRATNSIINEKNWNNNPRTKSSFMRKGNNSNGFNRESNEGGFDTKPPCKRSSKRIASNKGRKDNSMLSNEKLYNTLMDDSSINLALDEGLGDNMKSLQKRQLFSLPIKNFTKIKEMGMVLKTKCKSDRIEQDY